MHLVLEKNPISFECHTVIYTDCETLPLQVLLVYGLAFMVILPVVVVSFKLDFVLAWMFF